jgi:hypothetical protein
MPSQHGKFPFLQIAKTYPSAIKLDAGGSVNYFTTAGGFLIPHMPMLSFGVVSNGALAAGAYLTLATGALNQYTVIRRLYFRVNTSGNYTLAENANAKIYIYLKVAEMNVFDFGVEGAGDFCIFNLDELRVYNATGGVVGIDATALGYYVPYQT